MNLEQQAVGVSQWMTYGKHYGYDKYFKGKILEDISLRLPKKEDLVKLVDEDSRIWYETGYNQALAEVQALLDNMKKCL